MNNQQYSPAFTDVKNNAEVSPETINSWESYTRAYKKYQVTLKDNPSLSKRLRETIINHLNAQSSIITDTEEIIGTQTETLLANAKIKLTEKLEVEHRQELVELRSDNQSASQEIIERQSALFSKAREETFEKYKTTLINFFNLSAKEGGKYSSSKISRESFASTVPQPDFWEQEIIELKPSEESLRPNAERLADNYLINNNIRVPRRPSTPVRGTGDDTGYQIALREYESELLPKYQRDLQAYQTQRNNIIAQQLQTLQKNSTQTNVLKQQYMSESATRLSDQDWDLYLNSVKRTLVSTWKVEYQVNSDKSRNLVFTF